MNADVVMGKVRAAIAARVQGGQSIPKIAVDLGVDPATVYRWCDQDRNHYGRHLKAIGAIVQLATEADRAAA
jgi:transposase-like protein